MIRSLAFIISLSYIGLLSTSAAALDGDEVLKKVDDREYGAKDTTAVVKMELIDKDGSTSARKVKMFQKGATRRLIKFLEPADVKGMAFLDAGDDKMYLYLPAMHKIRRIAGHVKNDNFAGTDFSFDDLSSERFSERMKVAKIDEKGEHYLLDLKQRTGQDSQYGRLVMRVRKADFMFDRVEFYDKAGKKWKVMERKDFRDVGKYKQSFWAEMTDMKRNHKTRNIVESIEVDQDLKDKFFSKRQLKRR